MTGDIAIPDAGCGRARPWEGIDGVIHWWLGSALGRRM